MGVRGGFGLQGSWGLGQICAVKGFVFWFWFGVSEYSLLGCVALVFICVSSVVLVWVCI